MLPIVFNINYRSNRSLPVFVGIYFQLIHSIIGIRDKTFSIFQRATAARWRWLFPAVGEFSRCKFFSGNDFNSNGKKQTRPERKPFQASNSVSFYRFRSHRSIRKNLRRTFRFEYRFGYTVRQ